MSSLKNCSFPNLEILNLSFNKITDIYYLCKADFKNLKELYLNNNRINNINELKNAFPFLEILNLENNSISDINIFNRVLFSYTIKNLNLDKNPISKYEDLNFAYFPSINQINLGVVNKENENLLLISMKVQLFSYESFNESSKEKNEIIIEENDKISVLFIPETLSNVYKDIKSFNKRKIFKIIANSNITQEELEDFFKKNILKLPNKKFKIENFVSNETGNKNDLKIQKINNYSIFFYNDKIDIVNERIQSNIINLSDEYKKTHEISKKYNKIPGYLDIENTLFNGITCGLNYNNINNIKFPDIMLPNLIIDKKYELSELLKDNYYQRLPLLYININYYQKLIQFLNYYYKYKDYKIFDNIFIKYFLIKCDQKNIHHYPKYFEDLVFAGVFESSDCYSEVETIKIISEIKKIYINYKKFINNWIINIFDIMTDFILFVLNKKVNYYICPVCKNPILIINEYKEELNHENIINNKYNNKEDPFFYKSLKISQKLLDIIINNTDYSFIDSSEYIANKKGNGFKFVANPPKKDSFINLIYFNDNSYDSIKSEIDDFYNQTNGLFIFCNSLESFKDVINLILAKNENKCKFYLISNGRSFKDAIKYYVEEKEKKREEQKFDFIQKACIFCYDKEKYLGYLNDYNFLEGIYTLREDVIKFIQNNSFNDTIIYKSLKIITYDKYKKKYYKIHQMFAKYYRPNDSKLFTKFYQRFKEEMEKIINNPKLTESEKIENQEKSDELKKIFAKFNNITNSQNASELIKEYTKEGYFYPLINGWLLDIENWVFQVNNDNNDNWFIKIIKKFFKFFGKKEDKNNDLSFEKNAFFIGQLMYKLNYKIIESKKKNNLNYQIPNLILHRGLPMDFMESLIYPIQKGKIISFSTFTSTSKNEQVALEFSVRNKTDYDYSIIMKINVNQNESLFPMYFELKKDDKEDDTWFPDEEECLFPPFTFFKLTDFTFKHETKSLILDLEAIGKRSILELGLSENNRLIYDEKNNIMNYFINEENGEYYIGDLSNGHKNGQGIIYYKNNSIKYQGNFVNDKFEGDGRFNWVNGEYYDGNWKRGQSNGSGKIYYSNNNLKYEGNFSNGKPEGFGKYIWEDGEYYIGQWKNGLRHGKGKQYARNGKLIFRGVFENDNLLREEENDENHCLIF